MTEKEQIREYLEKLAPLKGNLSENVQNLLYFIVYMGGFASYAQIRKWASSRRISEHVLNGLVGTLNFKGFIEASSYGFASYGYSVGRHLYFNMAFRLLKFHRELCQEYQNLRIFRKVYSRGCRDRPGGVSVSLGREDLCRVCPRVQCCRERQLPPDLRHHEYRPPPLYGRQPVR